MKYGVTEVGFVKKRLPEITQEIIDSLKQNLSENGLNTNIETRPDSIIGLLIRTFAERESAIWEQQEYVYNAMYPDSSFGISLDRSVSTVGMKRLSAQKSTGHVIFYGKGLVEIGTKIKNIETQDIWHTREEKTIDNSEFADILLVPTKTDDLAYKVTIDDIDYIFSSNENSTIDEIVSGITSSISNPKYSVSSDGASISIFYKNGNNSSFFVSENITVKKIGVRIFCESKENLDAFARAGQLAEIVDFVDGIDSVNNTETTTSGRKLETDSLLRQRHEAKKFGYSKSILTAFDIALQEVPGVIEVKTFNNTTNNTDEFGRPPHSVHVVVDGGKDDDIAKQIFATVSAGIDTHGGIKKQIVTGQGRQTICFDRPKQRLMHVKMVLTKSTDDNDNYKVGSHQVIAKKIADIKNSMPIGEDVFIQKLYEIAYRFGGIENVDLKIAATNLGSDVPVFLDENIKIFPNERAIFDLSRVQVSTQ